MPPKADINKAGWEQSEFPILCETCACYDHLNFEPHAYSCAGLGDNAFVRMVRLTLFTIHGIMHLI